NGGPNDRGAWRDPPPAVTEAWSELDAGYRSLVEKFPRLGSGNSIAHLGSLGTGNHFIEVCLDETDNVWFMLHSGSRGVGNRIGNFFIELAKRDMRTWMVNLPDENLAYLPEGTEHFDEYWRAVSWAQRFAALNRELMMTAVVEAARHELSPKARL